MLLEKLESAGILQNPETLSRGERIICPGEMERNIYFIQDGAMRIFFVHDDEEYITRLAYSGDIITALDSFITKKPTDFYIEAIRSTTVRKASVEDYLRLMKTDAEMLEMWDSMLGLLVTQQMERERDLLIPSPAVRYERVVARSPKLFQEVPLKYIASYLRMTPETLSRILKS
ncbi:MAG: Crp/Fnr family transcriptional regulator [Flavobacteriia bacterium]|nr:Crp/Fnr family transcriptional regulator [Flavobacteriia bacterium]